MTPALFSMLIFFAAGAPASTVSPLTPLPLPGGEGGIGFDDLVYLPALNKVLIPAGRSGRLDLVDPKTLTVEAIEGFTASGRFAGGHGQGTTSADGSDTLIFASDRDRKRLVIVDPREKKILGDAPLAAGPDYVRWVAPAHEVWVTEPGSESIEYFTLETKDAPRLVRAGAVKISGGPESLVIDGPRGRAYTHTWRDATVVIDIKAHKEIARWQNGCKGARGIALDAARGLVFVGCEEGQVVALDAAHDGRQVGRVKTGAGVDIIAYNPRLAHLYVPGGGTLSVIGVKADGTLDLRESVSIAPDSRCAVADAGENAYVCDPAKGRLLVFHDRASPSGERPAR